MTESKDTAYGLVKRSRNLGPEDPVLFLSNDAVEATVIPGTY